MNTSLRCRDCGSVIMGPEDDYGHLCKACWLDRMEAKGLEVEE